MQVVTGTKFNSNSFVFRPTVMAAAFSNLGVVVEHYKREPKCFLLGRRKDDRYNIDTSVGIVLNAH